MNIRLFLSVLLLLLFAGCGSEARSKRASFLDGKVIVEYQENLAEYRPKYYLSFRFYEKGDYNVLFESPSRYKTPKNFWRSIDSAPQEIVFESKELPHELQITIVKDGGRRERKNF